MNKFYDTLKELMSPNEYDIFNLHAERNEDALFRPNEVEAPRHNNSRNDDTHFILRPTGCDARHAHPCHSD